MFETTGKNSFVPWMKCKKKKKVLSSQKTWVLGKNDNSWNNKEANCPEIKNVNGSSIVQAVLQLSWRVDHHKRTCIFHTQRKKFINKEQIWRSLSWWPWQMHPTWSPSVQPWLSHILLLNWLLRITSETLKRRYLLLGLHKKVVNYDFPASVVFHAEPSPYNPNNKPSK